MEVGRLTARLDAIFDDSAFEKFDRRLSDTKTEAKKGATAHLDAKADTSGLDKYDKALRRNQAAQDNIARSHARMGTALRAGGIAIGGAALGLGALAKVAVTTVGAFEDSEKVARRQALVIRTMGQDAGASAKHVDALAASMMKKTGVDDDAIISMANMIRTFKNIRNEAGEGNKIFDRTTKATLDMASAFGMDTQNAAIMLGKALDNPAKGAAALSRTGAIAKDDVEKLKNMAKDGVPILQQQKFVLEAVEKQVKGTAASNATATDKMKAQWGELEEAIGKKLAPTFNHVMKEVQKFVGQMIDGKGKGGEFVRALKEGFDQAKKSIKSAYEEVKPIVDFFMKHPKYIGVAVAAWGVYRAAVRATAIYTKMQLLSALRDRSLAQAAGNAGAAAGGPVGFGGKAASAAGKALRAFGWAGIGLSIAHAIGLDKAIGNQLDEAFGGKDTKLEKTVKMLRDLGSNTGNSLGPAIAAQTKYADAVKKTAHEYEALDRAKPKLGPLNREISNGQKEVSTLATKLTKLRQGSDEYTRTANKLKTAQKEVGTAIGIRGAAKDVADLHAKLSKLDSNSADYRKTALKLKDAQETLNKKLIDAERAGARGDKGVRKIGQGAGSAAGVVLTAASSIAANVNSLAASLGSKTRVSFAGVSAGAVAGAALRAGGGWIGSRGEAGRDEVPAMLGRGEAVLNRHQQEVIEGFLGHGFLDQLFGSVSKPHYLASGGKVGHRIPDVNIAGPAGGYRADAQGASDFMDAAAEVLAKKIANEPLNKMIRFARDASHKWPRYVYGGGHGSFSGPYDCSGYQSAILHAGGLLSSPMTTDGFKVYGQAGDGARVTIGVRGSTGKSAHTMGQYGKTFFEAGNPIGERGGWSGVFPIHRHPAKFARGGFAGVLPLKSGDGKGPIGIDAERVKRERPSAWQKIKRMGLGILHPSHPDFIGFGLSTGGFANFAKGGKVGAADYRKGVNFAGAGAGMIRGYEQKISNMERSYGQTERQLSRNDKDIIGEDANGNPVINQWQLNNQTGDLNKLRQLRMDIRKKIDAYRHAVKNAIKMYQKAVNRIQAAIKALKGAAVPKGKKRAEAFKEERKNRLDSYGNTLHNYQDKIGELGRLHTDLNFDWIDANEEVKDKNKEIKALDPKALASQVAAGQHKPDDKDPDPDPDPAPSPEDTTPPETPEAPTASDPTSGPPTAEDIARGVAEQFAQFNANRQELFASFGSNYSKFGSSPFGDDSARAAGMRAFGAFGNDPEAGGGITIVNNYKTQPQDPHTWSNNLDFELRTLI